MRLRRRAWFSSVVTHSFIPGRRESQLRGESVYQGIAVNGKLWAAGERGIHVYDPAAGAWEDEVRPSPPDYRGRWGGLVSFDDEVFAMVDGGPFLYLYRWEGEI